MGTGGAYGFYKNGITKVTYNQYDSYPIGLGEAVKTFLQTKPDLETIFNKIVLVSREDTPSAEQIAENLKWYDSRVSKQTPLDWYQFGGHKQRSMSLRHWNWLQRRGIIKWVS